MIYITLFLLTLFSVLLDLSLLRSLANRFTRRSWQWRIYLLHFVLLDGAMIVGISLFRSFSDSQGTHGMRIVMWIIFLFLASFVPKACYWIFSFLGRVVGWFRHRPVNPVFSKIGLAVAAGILLAMIYGATFGRTQIVVREIAVSSPKIPAVFDGYRIVFFSDLHIGNLPENNRFLRHVVSRIENLHPDLLVNGGDLVNTDVRELTPAVMEILSGLRARDGVCSVIGNHDLGVYMNRHSGITPEQNIDELFNRQRALGWQVLDNKTFYIRRGEDSISVTGVNYPIKDKLNSRQDIDFEGYDFGTAYRGVSSDLFNVLIAHTPKLWEEALASGPADLTLSGHVHAMQMKFGWGRWVWSPARWMYEHWSGLYQQGDKRLYVNDGMGYVLYPMRLGAPPELTVITLHRD